MRVTDTNDDKLHEECGVFGVLLNDSAQEASPFVYYGLFSLQHRGQESTGIASVKNGKLEIHKGMGLVGDNFAPETLSRLKGPAAVGHVRYSTRDTRDIENIQPFTIRLKEKSIAVAHNGNLTNGEALRDQLYDDGVGFASSGDAEIIAKLIAKNNKTVPEESISAALKTVEGAYALTILAGDNLVGARDPNGIRPLCLGQLEATGGSKGGWILSSESGAIVAAGGVFVRNIEPGELVLIDNSGVRSFRFAEKKPRAICSFEYVYFARPDSIIDGVDVYDARIKAGEILGKESGVAADLVIGVPDSGVPAAIGYGRATGTPFGMGIVKNKYIGRTFIAPEQSLREKAVFLKHFIIRSEVNGKRIVLIDDSIVRGTTSRRLVALLKNAGAKEVHIRICSPRVLFPCHYGIDTPHRKDLISNGNDVQELCKSLGADSLHFISVEGLLQTLQSSTVSAEQGFCLACFNGIYPVGSES